MKDDAHFDAVVIGSGFGGSVMSYRLAESGLDVCVLERGKRYPPGSFPRGPSGYHQNFWDPSEGAQGLFNVWVFKHLWAIVASGVGGGSLIYANVLLRKDERWFSRDGFRNGVYEYWPISRGDLERHYDAVERKLKAEPYPIDHPAYAETLKAQLFAEGARAAGLDVSHPNLAITFGNDPRRPTPGQPIAETHDNLHGRNNRSTCRLCGECDVGCNYGSKNSLDYNYLADAVHLHGAQIRDRCEVRTISQHPGGTGYAVEYVVHTEAAEGRKTKTRALQTRRITADRVILSAGSLGSTYLLLKNARELGVESRTLGTRFCGNGDFLGFVDRATARGSDGEYPAPLNPSFGPVITTAARAPDRGPGAGRGFYVQDAGYPEWVNWVLEALDVGGYARRAAAFGKTLLRTRLRGTPDGNLGGELAELLGPGHRSASTMPLLGMGHDSPDGRMFLAPSRSGQPYLQLDWRDEHSREYFERVRAASHDIAEAMGGSFKENLLSKLFNGMITVHPLGGCPMGRNANEGTVDESGQVFGCEGLYVADGAVMPGPTGANPSLTIAAVADRFADRILERPKAKSSRRSIDSSNDAAAQRPAPGPSSTARTPHSQTRFVEKGAPHD